MRIKNSEDTTANEILGQMSEPRPLPMGRQDFHEWADRIISGTLIPTDKDIPRPDGLDQPEVFIESQKFALANMLMHLGPTESHKPDAYFIHSLRKFAINQVADSIRKELHEAAKARTKAKEEAEGLTEAE